MEVPRPTLEILERTRRGQEVDPGDIAALVGAWATGAASDAQMAAWCATAGLRGVSYDASLAITRALLGGGDRLELSPFGCTADVRSAGGVGDSALILASAALAAALGVRVASTGARAIAHVGGVLDAIEAIPGMRSRMAVEDYVVQARDAGIVIAEPGDRLVPDERRLGRLRDATATAEGDILVAVAAAARGVSGGAGALVVEIPGGAGALLPDLDHAAAAGDLVTRLGAEWNRSVVAMPSLRAEPLAGVAGHALEVRAAIAVLRGEGDPDLAAAARRLAAAAAEASGVIADGAIDAASTALAAGEGATAAERWITAQGGDARVVADPGLLPAPAIRREVRAPEGGTVSAVDAGQVGATARWLGAGRLDPGQVIDPAVGVEVIARPGAVVAPGDVLAIVHASDDWLARRALDMLPPAFVMTGR